VEIHQQLVEVYGASGISGKKLYIWYPVSVMAGHDDDEQ
jgi:hypothetical protein